jgi:hypothetical protein
MCHSCSFLTLPVAVGTGKGLSRHIAAAGWLGPVKSIAPNDAYAEAAADSRFMDDMRSVTAAFDVATPDGLAGGALECTWRNALT